MVLQRYKTRHNDVQRQVDYWNRDIWMGPKIILSGHADTHYVKYSRLGWGCQLKKVGLRMRPGPL